MRLISKPDNIPKTIIPNAKNDNKNDYNYNYDCHQQAFNKEHIR